MDSMSVWVSRHFTQEGKEVEADIPHGRRTARITDPTGTVVFEATDLIVPGTWSQLATDIVASKYFRKRGVPTHLCGNPEGRECSVFALVHRVTRTLGTEGARRGYFETQRDQVTFEQELAFLLLHQYGAFNSPVWFNCGLFPHYGIVGSKGVWAWNSSTNRVEWEPNEYARPQTSACFILSVQDDLMEIYEQLKTEARLFNQGSGAGSNFSVLRSRHEFLSGGGRASGLLSFLEVFDRAAGSTKSGGTTRRAAKLVCLDMDHPEIEAFIGWKRHEEKKAHALIDAGYPADFNGEAYHTVGGQHANHSVRITDAFMRAVREDGPWVTRARTTGEIVDTYRARDLWRHIAEAAWACADPGVQFHDTMNRWHPYPHAGPIRASNPCGEFLAPDDNACNLASLNLTKFLEERENGTCGFRIADFQHAVRVFLLAQEILVDYGGYPTAAIAKNAHDYRQLGLGYANLGALLMQLGVPYDSDEGRGIAASITALMTGEAYTLSAEMAQVLGPFAGFEANAEAMRDVLELHVAALPAAPPHTWEPTLREAAKRAWKRAQQYGTARGYRNAQVTLLAPAGTIGLLMDCDTTGIEPDFALVKYKKLAGGGTTRIVNHSVERALLRLGYAAETIRAILRYVVGDVVQDPGHGTLEGAPGLRPEHLPVFDCANAGGGTRVLSVDAHLGMLAAVQPFLSMGISKTINLPNDATVEDVQRTYERAYAMGIKSVALYRDGCKRSQPLSGAVPRADITAAAHAPPSTTRTRLPKRRHGFTQEAKVAGHKIFLRTGEFEDGQLGEIFVDMHKEGASFRALMNSFAIAVSLGLQHGVPLEAFVEQFTFTRFEPSGIVEGHARLRFATSLLDYLFRSLAVDYLGRDDLAQVASAPSEPNGLPPPQRLPRVLAIETEGSLGDCPLCPECGHLTVRNASCYRCLSCGTSLGCS